MMHRWVLSLNLGARNGLAAALCALVLPGCGEAPQVVRSVPGGSKGGVSGGPMFGTLTVQAVDADSALPIAGAAVWLGTGERALPVGRTAADGTLTLSDLGGVPQTVTVMALGYAAASWGLISSAVATIPLETMSLLGHAEVTVDLPGWSELPPLAAGSYRVARFASSRPNGLSALEATSGSVEPDCKQPSATKACSVTLSVPADSSALLAVIAQANDAGTADDPSDDAFTMTGLGVATQLVLQPGTARTVSISLLEPSATARASVVARGSTPQAFEDVVGVPGISIDGQILLYPNLGGASTSFLVPTATGVFTAAKLWAVATAGNGSQTDWSRSYERGIAPPRATAQTITLQTSDFLGLPSIGRLAPSAFTLSSPGNLARLEFSTPSGQELNVLLFPTQSGFEVPAGVLDQPPSAVSVEAFDAALDPSSFEFQDSAGRATHIAYAHTEPLQ